MPTRRKREQARRRWAGRAQAVAAFLRLNGVPADVIKVMAFGADRPLVLTVAAEPQNRRVQLIPR